MIESEPEERNETPLERVDRNWGELLQELRVTQTGNQILFGFLLILPFQNEFGGLGTVERGLYLAVFILVSLSTVFNVAPAAAHRLLFSRRRKKELVLASSAWAKTALVLLGLALGGAVALVVDMVLGLALGITLGAAVLLSIVILWLIIPLRILREGIPEE